MKIKNFKEIALTTLVLIIMVSALNGTTHPELETLSYKILNNKLALWFNE